ncbi:MULTISPECIES: nucleotide exchange factor GrpE [Megasphaera]|uniref:Protein GrpE n=1 Tax=Megasphaera stantonii TaxID=2144175 RepID=A0A346B286_9FIRM|nr:MULTISPECIES: nucleotide exchange factor GrpE [Megasphaera]AXL22229.1 nucleotide exchange factor GrpE [Megasphaera stantonii]MCU6714707.1 nucleotide exchange factor GrpE [Megasphaera butyrica]SCH71664.1 HSP-70 cofactor [uncultured Megasphaera sp.]SCJ29045.1 HSP-70 cofactor [uncultured Ruminococcus sp.]
MSKDKEKDKEKKHEQQAAAEAAEAENAKVNESAEQAEPAQDAGDAPAADEEQAAEDAASTDAKIAEAAVADMKQRYMRLQADFANFKKRTAGEKLQISEVVKMEVLQNVLPVVDNFERALQVPQDKLTDDLKSFVDGYEMIYKQLMTVLEKEGVVKIDAVGKPFDPNYHQAVMRVASDEYDNDVVVEVLQEGYLLGDKTLRPAMVKVAFNG